MATSSEAQQNQEESDFSSDDWDYRSRSSSGDSIHHLMRQRSFDNDSSLDLSFLSLDTDLCLANLKQFNTEALISLNLSGNSLTQLPNNLNQFAKLQILDLSQNGFDVFPEELCQLTQLKTLIAANNHLNDSSFPKNFGKVFAETLRVLSLGGNKLTLIPDELLELTALKSLYLGDNAIENVSKEIHKLESLRVLYLGGNQLETIPDEVGRLQHLEMLSLCENRLNHLPSTIAQLRNLRSLALHRNKLTTLPPEIVKLRGLIELSLRNNPLVVRFVRDMMYDPPSLMELAARAIKVNKINYRKEELPKSVYNYLGTAHRCLNPKCKGVYFDSRFEHIKFVDFCGSYRLPLLQYLCSPKCSSSSPAINRNSSDSESDTREMQVPEFKIKKVLLG